MVRWDALTKAVGREVRATRAERSLTTLVHLIFIVVCWADGGVKKVAYELILSCQPELRISRSDRSEMSVAKLAIETGLLLCPLPCFLLSSSLETIGVDRNRVASCDKFNLRCPIISRGIPDSCRSYACSRVYDRCRVSRTLRQSLQINVLTLSKSVKSVRSGERWGGNLSNGALELPVEKRSSLVGCEIYSLVTRLCTKQANLPSSHY